MRMTAFILAAGITFACSAQAQSARIESRSFTPFSQEASSPYRQSDVVDEVIRQLAHQYGKEFAFPSNEFAIAQPYFMGGYHQDEGIRLEIPDAFEPPAFSDGTAVAAKPLDLRLDPRWVANFYAKDSVADLGSGSKRSAMDIRFRSNDSEFNDDERYYFTQESYMPNNQIYYNMHETRVTLQNRVDELEDRVFPGFGHIETKFDKIPVRIDYLDGHRCSKARLAICLSAKW